MKGTIKYINNDNEYARAPFPYFGGKTAVVDTVWQRFGTVQNYVEPFFGSGIVLLKAPKDESRLETINDKDGFVANFWRAIKADPEQTAYYADNPVFENDLHARHIYLVNESKNLVERLEGDIDYYDAKIAGWWCWGLCSWIGSSFCKGNGPWAQDTDAEGYTVLRKMEDKSDGINRQLIHLSNKGKGVNRQLIHLTNHGKGITSKAKRNKIYDWFNYLSNRLRLVRVCCGDWSRVTGNAPTISNGLTAMFFDPPYTNLANRAEVYANDSFSVGHDVYQYCLTNGDNPKFRIALCGYEGEYEFPDSWEKFEWRANGGYSMQKRDKSNINCHKERIWFSPHCIRKADNNQYSLTF